MPARCTIGVDLGGTKCAAGIVNIDSGAVVERTQRPTSKERGGAAVLHDVLRQILELLHRSQDLGLACSAVGLGAPELVARDGRILSAANFDWRGVDVAQQITAATGLPSRLDADVRCGGRAEAHFGAGRGCQDFLYVTIGTGISAALVVGQEPYRGARGLSGTFASSPIGNRVGCAPAMTLEEFAAGPGVAARYAAVQPGFQGDATDVCACAEIDPLAAKIVASSGDAIGAALGDLVNLLDPERIVLGGGMGVVDGAYRHAIDAAMRRRIYCDHHRDLPLVTAQCGADAGLLGAALMATRNP